MWWGTKTIEFRFPNATLDAAEAFRTIELCLRWVAAVGAGRELPADLPALTAALEVPVEGYPPPHPEPIWHRREELLTELLLPVLQPLVSRAVPGAEILFVRPREDGLYVKTDLGDRENHRFLFRPHQGGFELLSFERIE